ncbi:MAG: YajG family lipoprotein [Chromatiales bacterium]
MDSRTSTFALILRARGRIGSAALIAVAALVVGCALSPQSVQLEPGVSVETGDLGRGRTVALSVADRRPDKAIGTRGGVYSATSTITAGDVSAAVQKSMTEALTAMGFRVEGATTPADLRMQVNVDALTYSARGNPVVSAVEIGAKVSSTLETGAQQYSSRAGFTETRDVIRPPAPEDNEAYINDALAHALERLLRDPKFVEFVR